MVGLGASAGGIAALSTFFAQTQPGESIAYVVILHLSPDYESQLARVLQTTAPFPVTQVRDTTPLEADHVYVISPNLNLRIAGGALVVDMMTTTEERKAPVDLFFRSLADAYTSSAVAIVLSGTGPNGSNGLKRIKEHGGLTIAQDPQEAEFPDMPNNSIATGLVDYVLRVGSMPRRLVEYRNRLATIPAQTPEGPPDGSDLFGSRAAQDWRDILSLLRTRTGQDFSNYKPATIRRRVERRMSVRGLGALSEYAQVMRENPDESLLLMKELLISVTNFFRDPETFAAIEKRVLPLVFQPRAGSPSEQIRVWSAGCATGEEAYSIAILLAECAGSMVDAPAVQVFATDLDEQAIAVAREGLYSEADVADLSPVRLARFFQREAGGYRVRRELRDMVLFAHHNVIRDPPFSHLDLIVCRNLLIYLNRTVQERLLETFHFALRPGGYLFLGTSEWADGGADLFVAIDKDAHIFESRTVSARPPLPIADRPVPAPLYPRMPEPRSPSERISPGELHLRLLEQYAPPSLVVNEEYSLMHISPGASALLQMTPGEPSRDLLRLVHPDLRVDVRTALNLAARERSTVEVRQARSPLADGKALRIVVKPALRDDAPPRGYFLVLFETEDAVPRPAEAPVRLTSPAMPETAHLSDELVRVKTQLRTTIEQYETHSEEARAANEELQAMNEELRSAAEELETSKEELQSVNEELTTVNQELKVKIEELGLTNNDFQNLINSTDIAVIFLDRALRVKLSTPRATDIFNLLPSDTGRRLSDITSKLAYEPLHEEIAQVLERLQTIEREVQTREGRWFLMRILPYRTTDDRIDGVAMTFHDVTARKLAEERLRSGEERLRLLIDSASDYAIFTMTGEGIIDSWNTGAQRMFGYMADEIIGQSGDILFTPEDRRAGVPALELETARQKGRALDERWHMRKDETRFYVSGVTTRLGPGVDAGFAKIARDLTPRREAELALTQAHSDLEQRVGQRTEQLQLEMERRGAAQQEVSQLLRRVVTAQEEQRGRISRDLHDQLGQQLTALRLALEHHRGQCPAGAADDLERAQALTQEIDGAIDFLAWELRPAILDDLGLPAALPRYVEEWSAHHGIAARFEAGGTLAERLPPDVETAFYRIAQEALNNVVKHAHATRADVVLERRDGELVLVIEDDGVGFDPAAPGIRQKGIGLAGMRERAALAGATLQVESAPGKGTSVFLRRPASEAAR